MTLVLWLHLLAMAFFVGGQICLPAVVVPAARGSDQMRAIARGFGVGTLYAMGELIATGVALASHFDKWADGTLHAKLGLVVLTGVLVLVHIRRPAWRALDGAIFVSSLAIVWLGVELAT
jgi:putative copper export protein